MNNSSKIVGGRVDCPIEFLDMAINTPELFAQELLSYSTGSSNPFFRRLEKVTNAITDKPNPMDTRTYMFEDWFVCNDELPRYIHTDLSISGDAVGMAMCHSKGFTSVYRSEFEEEIDLVSVDVPVIDFDFAVRLNPRPEYGEKGMNYSAIQAIFRNLVDRGFNLLGGVSTFDRFQSHTLITSLVNMGIPSGILSIDHTTWKVIVDFEKDNYTKRESITKQPAMPWMDFREMIYQNRIKIPGVEEWKEGISYLEKEANESVWNPKNQKVEKMNGPGTSDDLIQSIVGASFNCQNNIIIQDLPELSHDSKYEQKEENFYKAVGQPLPNSSTVDKDRESLGQDGKAVDEDDDFLQDDFYSNMSYPEMGGNFR